MPIKTSKLFLSSAQRTSGTAANASFSNIKWESLIPTGVRKIRVRAKFWTPPSICTDVAATRRELMVVTARLPGSVPTYDASGSYPNVPLFVAQRSIYDATQTAGAALATSYSYDSADASVHELLACPHGEINISTFYHTLANGEFVATDAADLTAAPAGGNTGPR